MSKRKTVEDRLAEIAMGIMETRDIETARRMWNEAFAEGRLRLAHNQELGHARVTLRDAAVRRDDAFTALAVAQTNYLAVFRHGCDDETADELTKARDFALAELIAADSDFHNRIDDLGKSRRVAS